MRQTASNVKGLLIQSVVSSAAQFFVYKVLFDAAGPVKMGQWAVILAITTFIAIAAGGIGSGVVRYMALPPAEDDPRYRGRLVSAAFWLSLGFNTLLAVALYFGGLLYLRMTLGAADSPENAVVLAYTLTAMVISSLAAIFSAAMDGAGLFSRRATIVSLGYLVYLIAAIICIREYGLAGIAYGLIIQSAFVFILAFGYLLVQRIIAFRDFFYIQRSAVFQLLRFGGAMQLVNIIMLFFDPVAKYFITSSGGLQAVGYYEMANRLVMQVRNVLTGTGQVLVPKTAALHGVDDATLRDLLKSFILQNNNIAICIQLVLLAAGWVISFLWLGEIQEQFITAYVLISVGWFFNALSAPAYYYFMGTGELKYNLVQHLLFGLVTVIGYVSISGSSQDLLLFAVPAFALIIGSIYLLHRFQGKIRLRPKVLLPPVQSQGVVACLLFAGLFLFSNRFNEQPLYAVITTLATGVFLLYFVVKRKILFELKSILRP